MVRNLLRLDVYLLYSMTLSRCMSSTPLPDEVRLVVLASQRDLLSCPMEVLQELDAHNGCGVLATIASGGRIYALLNAGTVLSQLRIEFQHFRASAPTDLEFTLDNRSAFLGFLHTPALQRRAGYARLLVAATCERLANEGWQRCVCHVQGTNARSKNTFERLGWHHAAWLIAAYQGRMLGFVATRSEPAAQHWRVTPIS